MKNKKLLSCILCATVLLTMTTSVFAVVPPEDAFDGNIEEPAEMAIHNIQDFYAARQILLDSDEISENDKKILRGENFAYGDNDTFYSDRNMFSLNGEISPQWKGGGRTYTHQYITRVALIILSNDLISNPLDDYVEELAEASDKPDEDENSLFTYKWHFYDPNTGESYSGSTSALDKLVEHYNAAVSEYNSGDIDSAMDRLGRACHYVEDLSEPHHAANKTVLNSNHGDFEEFVNDNRSDYGTITMGAESYNYGRTTSVANMGHNFAIYAKSKLSLAENANTYHQAALDTVPKAQRNTACLLYKFMIDVELVD
jgi:phospholipase C